MNCYTEEMLAYENPLFTRVPITFVITMSNSTRRTQYMKELNETRLTARVIVLHNKGYKKCKKPGVDTPAIDLWHANLYAAKRANELVPGQPVFIVEDDVEFTDNISKFSDSIEDFFLNKTEPSAYKLGCCPFLSYSLSEQHLRVFHGGTTHAVLYNAAALTRFSNFHIRWLHDLEMYQYLYVYTCSHVCATQHFDFTTENSQNWNILHIPEFTYTDLCNNDQAIFFTYAHTIGKYGGLYVLLTIIITIIITLYRSF